MICIESKNDTTVCLTCGVLPEKIHRPLFGRGAWCRACCPECAKPALAAAAKNAANSVYVDAPPRSADTDPWLRDDRRDPQPGFIPQQKGWF